MKLFYLIWFLVLLSFVSAASYNIVKNDYEYKTEDGMLIVLDSKNIEVTIVPEILLKGDIRIKGKEVQVLSRTGNVEMIFIGDLRKINGTDTEININGTNLGKQPIRRIEATDNGIDVSNGRETVRYDDSGQVSQDTFGMMQQFSQLLQMIQAMNPQQYLSSMPSSLVAQGLKQGKIPPRDAAQLKSEQITPEVLSSVDSVSYFNLEELAKSLGISKISIDEGLQVKHKDDALHLVLPSEATVSVDVETQMEKEVFIERKEWTMQNPEGGDATVLHRYDIDKSSVNIPGVGDITLSKGEFVNQKGSEYYTNKKALKIGNIQVSNSGDGIYSFNNQGKISHVSGSAIDVSGKVLGYDLTSTLDNKDSIQLTSNDIKFEGNGGFQLRNGDDIRKVQVDGSASMQFDNSKIRNVVLIPNKGKKGWYGEFLPDGLVRKAITDNGQMTVFFSSEDYKRDGVSGAKVLFADSNMNVHQDSIQRGQAVHIVANGNNVRFTHDEINTYKSNELFSKTSDGAYRTTYTLDVDGKDPTSITLYDTGVLEAENGRVSTVARPDDVTVDDENAWKDSESIDDALLGKTPDFQAYLTSYFVPIVDNNRWCSTKGCINDESMILKYWPQAASCLKRSGGYCCIPENERGAYEEVKCQGSGLGMDGSQYSYDTISTTPGSGKGRVSIAHGSNIPTEMRTVAGNFIPGSACSLSRGQTLRIQVVDANGNPQPNIVNDICFVAEDTGSAFEGVCQKTANGWISKLDVFAGYGASELSRISNAVSGKIANVYLTPCTPKPSRSSLPVLNGKGDNAISEMLPGSSGGVCSGELQLIASALGSSIAKCGPASAPCRLRTSALQQLQKAQTIAKTKYGVSLEVYSGYRTEQSQEMLYVKSGRNRARVCGPNNNRFSHCPHVTGCAVDIRFENGRKDNSLLLSIMSQAGWVRYDAEAWHFEYGTTRWMSKTNGGTRIPVFTLPRGSEYSLS